MVFTMVRSLSKELPCRRGSIREPLIGAAHHISGRRARGLRGLERGVDTRVARRQQTRRELLSVLCNLLVDDALELHGRAAIGHPYFCQVISILLSQLLTVLLHRGF